MDSISSPPMAQSSTGNLVMSPLMISMLGVVVTSAAITLYHLFLIKYCMRRHGGVTFIVTPRLTDGSYYTGGIQPNVLEKIPIFTFAVVKQKIDQDECVVCLGELEDEDEVRLLPFCKHAFHVKCIDQWFQMNANCPVCRSIPGETNVEFFLDSHRTNDLDPEGGESSPSNSSRDSSPRTQSFGLLRHCVSMALPPTAERRSPPCLKRSLSMDQSFVGINVQNDTASSSARGVLTRSRSLSPFGRVSSKWLKSFSRLRVGKGSSNGAILPY